jgi:hypothetical protein
MLQRHVTPQMLLFSQIQQPAVLSTVALLLNLLLQGYTLICLFQALRKMVHCLNKLPDISTIDVDVSRSHYSDNELPTDVAGMYSADDSSLRENCDCVTTDASSNNDGVDVTNDIETDFSLLRKYNSYLSSCMGQMKGSTLYQRDIELLCILMKAKSPMYLFVQIKACFRTMVHVSKINLLDKTASLSRKAVLKQIYKRFDLHGSQPVEIEATLPGSNDIVSIVTHDFKEQLYSLVSDSVVMQQDEHLLFPKNEHGHSDLFADPCIVHHQIGLDKVVYNDVIDGDAYKTAYQFHCTVKDSGVLLHRKHVSPKLIWNSILLS